jgi:hypothetical protein
MHGRGTPGPAYYTPASGHGRQVYSGKANPPAIGFCKELLFTDPKVSCIRVGLNNAFQYSVLIRTHESD